MLSLKLIILLILNFVVCFNCATPELNKNKINIENNNNNGCVIPFTSKNYWNVFWPLVFHINGSLYETKIINNEEVAVVIPIGEEVLISCSPNYIKKQSPTEYLRAKCQTNRKFTLTKNYNDGDISKSEKNISTTTQTVLLDDLSDEYDDDALKTIRGLKCDLRVIEEVLETVTDCPTSAISVNFGYVNPISQLSHIIGEACYNTMKGRTYFAHVRFHSTIKTEPSLSTSEINGKDITLNIQPKSFLKSLPHPPTGYKRNFMRAFRLDEFNNRLRTILNVENVPWFEMHNYIDENLLGSQQQFYAPIKKLSWNYLILHENLENFKLLKKDISDLNDVDIYIGSHGVTTLKDVTGNNVPIYLTGKKFPLPEIVWIIVKNKDKATSFAVFNNPSLIATEIENNNTFCSYSKCEEITWLNRIKNKNVRLNNKNGIIICCSYKEFKKSVEEVPNLDNIVGLYT